jgi:hypothetical protein
MSYNDPTGHFGVVGGVGGQGSTFGGSASANGYGYLGEDCNGAGVGVAGSAGATAVSVGASLGKGGTAGFYANTIESFLASNSFDFNSPIGGISLYLNNNGEFEGVTLGGPSAGISLSFTPSANSIGGSTGVTFIGGKNGGCSCPK